MSLPNSSSAERASSPPSAPSGDEPETIEVPAHYAREIQERQRIIDACPVKVFTSSVNPRWAWPWKLNASNRARTSIDESCEELIIDPGLYNHCGPLEAAHAAAKTGADYLIARDLPPGHYPDVPDEERYRLSIERAANYFVEHRTLRERESVILGRWELAHNADAIAPIQPPYIDSLEYMSESIKRRTSDGPVYVNILDETDYIAVGGLLSFDDTETRVEKLREVRDYVGDEMRIHALAPGTGLPIIRAIRDDPNLIDSLDVSTPETAPANGKLPDKTWSQRNHSVPRGVDSTTIRGQYSNAIAMQLTYMLGPFCTDEILERNHESTHQQTLDEVSS